MLIYTFRRRPNGGLRGTFERKLNDENERRKEYKIITATTEKRIATNGAYKFLRKLKNNLRTWRERHGKWPGTDIVRVTNEYGLNLPVQETRKRGNERETIITGRDLSIRRNNLDDEIVSVLYNGRSCGVCAHPRHE